MGAASCCEINVTPLVDVVFGLADNFHGDGPMLQMGIDQPATG